MIKLVYELAKELDMNVDTIEKIVRSEFEFVKETMESGKMESVLLHHFGRFQVKPGRLKYLNKTQEDNGGT